MKHLKPTLLILLLCTGCFHNLKTDKTYSNNSIGIKVEFPEIWSLSTTRQNSHDMFIKYFPKNSKKDELPLFFGMKKNQKIFVRALIEKTDISVMKYFRSLHSIIINEGKRKILSAKYSEKTDTIVWVFKIKKDNKSYLFKEYITKSNNNLIKLAFWSTPFYMKKNEKDIKSVFNNTLLKNEKLWVSRFKNIENNRTLKNIGFVKITEKMSEAYCLDTFKRVFWEVKGDTNSVYILGALPFGRKDLYPFKNEIEMAFEKSKYFVCDLNRSPENSEELQKYFLRGRIKGKKSIKDYISQDLYKMLTKSVKSYGLPVSSFRRFKPWLLSINLSQVDMRRNGYSDSYSATKYFLRRSGKKQISELYTASDYINQIMRYDGKQLLKNTLNSLNHKQSDKELLLDFWNCGDLTEMEDIIFKIKKAKIKYNKLYRDDYSYINSSIADKIKPYLKKNGDCFVVLGVEHFMGKSSIINILKNNNFNIIRK
ncbi:MAG: TraB/GumN family protein [Desulfobacterales bacterium]|nr:TraB/GumN family protein [Desulfobacterales bacterium]